ncbi:VOC family protein [Bacillus paramycoides]|uniref:VOC family protein n=1 Tax=Bacillus paramycoides TaxID=2026194 RepID=UPI002E1AFD7E|nr:VOC family protein [Bacillus paramycoides]
MTKNYLHHICIQTNTYLETLAFYTKALGFEIVEESPNFHGRAFNTWLKLGAFYIELQTGRVSRVRSYPWPIQIVKGLFISVCG